MSGWTLKHSCIAANLSKQSDPFGSALDETKQEKASLKNSPQGGARADFRQGQSQLISPVSSFIAEVVVFKFSDEELWLDTSVLSEILLLPSIGMNLGPLDLET